MTGYPAGPLSADTAAPDAPSVTEARRAMVRVYAVFIGSGFSFASWASRIPQVRDRLHLDPGQLGLVLLAIALGSMVALPVAGMVVTKLGAARSVASMSIVLAVGLAAAAIGYRIGVFPVVGGLFLVGFGNGTWDVAMNVEGAAVEQQLGRTLMPKFHAGYSIGTVAGALSGSAMVAWHIGVTPHLLAVSVIVGVVVPLATRGFLPARETPHGAEDPAQPRHPLRAWTESRTLLIGLFVLCMAFTEGTGNDWLGVAMIDGYGARAAVGSLTFAVFVSAMTAGRWFGPLLIERWGRVRALRASAATAFSGLVIVVFSGSLAAAMGGAVLWGLGAALGFPVGMSAAADDPRHAAGRVSVAASIGYLAFLAGPPTVGALGNAVGTLHSLTIAAGLLALAVGLAAACREP